ncbi:fibronectin_type III domain-containing protein [Hexamita inflata]|uniref:Fibronectin type III domain-containing protein n=1 Tax=Hexamita inflata TaxID=28002 RepID=A0AA86UQP8_9EUKA|nr:fibronectin type III domain-containing protein [Hexamita inflata]
MKDLETLYAWQTEIVDLHPLQYLHSLVHINLNESKVIDVTPLKNLNLDELFIGANRVQSFLPIQHHKNFYCYEPINDEFDPRYSLTGQEVPTVEELKFYNKILSVHSSYKQIREIKNENKITKFRNSLAQNKSYVSVMLNNQIMKMNKEVDILVRFIQNINSE